MQKPARDRLFAHLAQLSMSHAIPVLITFVVLAVGAAVLIPGLHVSTSRHGLVEAENPYQARMLRFFERFGDPNSPIFFVIGGSTASERRQVVDELVKEVTAHPDLKQRVIARMGPDELAEVLLLQDEQTLADLHGFVATSTDAVPLVEGGLPKYLEAAGGRIDNLIAGLQMQMLVPLGGTVSAEQVNQLLTNLEYAADFTGEFLTGTTAVRPREMSKRPGLGLLDSAGYVVSQANEFLLVTVFPEFASDEVDQFEPMIEFLRGARDKVLSRHASKGIFVKVTGLPALAVDEMTVITKGLFQSSLATGLGIIILFMLAFRSIRQSAITMVPLFCGTVLTLAFVRLVYGELNLITSSFISVLLGLGIDFPVHLLSRFNEFRRRGASVAIATASSLAKTGPGIMTGAFTTILAFLTTTTTDFTAFAELGVITAVGLLIMLIATLVLLPTLIFQLEIRRDVVKPELPGIALVTGVVQKMPRVLVLGGVVIAILGSLALDRIGFNYRYFDFLPQETESAQALRMLENDLAMGPTFANVTASSIEEARDYAEKLRVLPSVASVQTATDLLPPLTNEFLKTLTSIMGAFDRQPDFSKIATNAMSSDELQKHIAKLTSQVEKIRDIQALTGASALQATATLDALQRLTDQVVTMGPAVDAFLQRAAVEIADIVERAWLTADRITKRKAYTPDDLPEVLQRRFVARDKSALALYVYPSGDIWQRDFASKFAKDLEQVDPEVSGFAITLHAHSTMILSGFKRAAMFAALLILLLLLYDFRSLPDALCAVLPTCIGWLAMLTVMTYFDLRFNVANIVALPLVLGIGIDAGVHVMHRCNESADANNGIARLRDLLTGTGSAVMLASATTMVGFAGLMVADYGAMKSLGLVMVIGIGCCLIACLLILPAVLMLLGRAQFTNQS